MKLDREQHGLLGQIVSYVLNLRDSSPYWRLQAAAWGIILVVVIAVGGLFAFLALSSIFGGGTINYEAKGSPGPVRFSHYSHMWFNDGKYKACKTCHDRLFAAQVYGTFVFRVLKDSPPRKFRIGKDMTTLFVPDSAEAGESTVVTYQTSRACRTCATGQWRR
jgi:hypothetical protein